MGPIREAIRRFVQRCKNRQANEPKGRVPFDRGCFSIWKGEKREAAARWSQVREIVAYKRDLFTVDLICIGFRVSDEGAWPDMEHGEWLEITEWDLGFDFFMERLSVLYPSVPKDWWSRVVLPAFEPCATILYRRA